MVSTFAPRDIVNGNLLGQYTDKRVSIHVNIEDNDSSGTILKGKTTDGLSIQVTLNEPANSPIRGWVEIIGVATGSEHIKCDDVPIQFEFVEGDETFDTDAHNMLIQFMIHAKDIYKSSGDCLMF